MRYPLLQPSFLSPGSFLVGTAEAGIEMKACALVAARHPTLKAHGWDVVVVEAVYFDPEAVDIADCFENPDPRLSLPKAIGGLE
jgi:hypothetical protein